MIRRIDGNKGTDNYDSKSHGKNAVWSRTTVVVATLNRRLYHSWYMLYFKFFYVSKAYFNYFQFFIFNRALKKAKMMKNRNDNYFKIQMKLMFKYSTLKYKFLSNK